MSKSILVIDDEEGIRESFVLALEDTAYHVDTAASGTLGVASANQTNYNLIFLDLKMPGKNGVETLRELREKDREVPIYIVTAFHKEFLEELKTAAEDGIEFELLQKPIGSDQIVSVAQSILEGPIVS